MVSARFFSARFRLARRWRGNGRIGFSKPAAAAAERKEEQGQIESRCKKLQAVLCAARAAPVLQGRAMRGRGVSPRCLWGFQRGWSLQLRDYPLCYGRVSVRSTAYTFFRFRRGTGRCGRSSAPCAAAFLRFRRPLWRRRCRRPRARASPRRCF